MNIYQLEIKSEERDGKVVLSVTFSAELRRAITEAGAIEGFLNVIAERMTDVGHCEFGIDGPWFPDRQTVGADIILSMWAVRPTEKAFPMAQAKA